MKLMFTEMKRILKNPIFWITVVLIFVFIQSQFGSELNMSKMNRPLPNQENYGMTKTNDMAAIRENAMGHLLQEYSINSYTTYPYGFYRDIELNKEKDEQISKVISALSGISLEDIKKLQNDSGIYQVKRDDKIFNPKVTDEQFIELMDKVDELLGGGSVYSKKLISSRFGERPKTYDEAVKDYELMIKKDKISGAYARVFCDYAGIVIGIIPVFLAVAFWFQDKRSKCEDLLFTRSVSSSKLIISRYLAMLILLSIFLMAIASYYNLQIIKDFGWNKANPLYFYGYTLIWLMPTLMVVLSLGIFSTVATNSPLGILVMMIWWFLDVMKGARSIDGGYGHSLVLRHNIVGNTQLYLNNKNMIFINRGIYVLLAIVILFISMKIYDLKREGKVFVHGIYKK